MADSGRVTLRRRRRKPDGLERIIDAGGASDFEVQLYETARDPQIDAISKAQRRDEGQTRRHRRRLEARAKHDRTE